LELDFTLCFLFAKAHCKSRLIAYLQLSLEKFANDSVHVYSVASGENCMGFYFKGDQLYTRRGKLEGDDASTWTSILMDMREPIDIPEMTEFGQFLSCSLVST
jgi:hypothetical protein